MAMDMTNQNSESSARERTTLVADPMLIFLDRGCLTELRRSNPEIEL